MIRIWNEDCFLTLDRLIQSGEMVDAVLTSPPYNSSRSSSVSEKSRENYETRYDVYMDTQSDEEYIDWTLKLFEKFGKILQNNGVVLYNISYSTEAPNLMWCLVADLVRKTEFCVGDYIVWKKNTALPNNVSPNKLTRLCESVFVFCRKGEFDTYRANKKVNSIREKTQQKMYASVYNIIDAANNDGPNPYNKATFSSELCRKLLGLYGFDGMLVYDPFMGTGTTALACKQLGYSCYGSELSENQYRYALDRLEITPEGGERKDSVEQALLF